MGGGLMQGSGVPTHPLTTSLSPFLIKEDHWPKKHVFSSLCERGQGAADLLYLSTGESLLVAVAWRGWGSGGAHRTKCSPPVPIPIPWPHTSCSRS